jgi:hypothetical protein
LIEASGSADEADAGECHLGGKPREAGSCNRAGAGQAEVLVDDENAILGLAELARLGGKRILALGRFAIVLDLARARLAQIDDRLTREMLSRDLGTLIHGSSPSPRLQPACGR